MIYTDLHTGRFISRPNRFIAHVEINGAVEVCHVKNTGRCRELLVPGAKVYLDKSPNPDRKTKYDLVAVQKGDRLINMDSQAPNKVFHEYLLSGKYIEGITLIRPETTYGASRFDFYVETPERRIFIEVKGVTLERDGVILFPDAPTERGVKHLNELAAAMDAGYEAHAVFVIQMSDVKYFAPNRETHPQFADALKAAAERGVVVTALDCTVKPGVVDIKGPVPVRL